VSAGQKRGRLKGADVEVDGDFCCEREKTGTTPIDLRRLADDARAVLVEPGHEQPAAASEHQVTTREVRCRPGVWYERLRLECVEVEDLDGRPHIWSAGGEEDVAPAGQHVRIEGEPAFVGRQLIDLVEETVGQGHPIQGVGLSDDRDVLGLPGSARKYSTERKLRLGDRLAAGERNLHQRSTALEPERRPIVGEVEPAGSARPRYGLPGELIERPAMEARSVHAVDERLTVGREGQGRYRP
jgi:hypothetical protein